MLARDEPSLTEMETLMLPFALARRTTFAGIVLSLAALSPIASAATWVMVGGAPMLSSKVIPENASKAKNLTTLVSAVKAAGLVETLSGPGPFTVFAPTNAAFAKLPKGTVEKLVEPDMKPQLTAILTYHVVPGRLTAADLMDKASAMGGTAELKTVAGGTLTVSVKGKSLWVTDEAGNTAKVETADVLQKNGVVHVIDHVLMPKM
jgi:uncharacterized surface protein with fasciclin (FAS1) repeats